MKILAPQAGQYRLSITVDGEEVNGTPLDVVFSQETRNQTPSSEPQVNLRSNIIATE